MRAGLEFGILFDVKKKSFIPFLFQLVIRDFRQRTTTESRPDHS